VLTDLFSILFFTGAILLFVRLFVDLWHEICSRYVYTLYLNFCLFNINQWTVEEEQQY
jgi:hypothetical protein